MAKTYSGDSAGGRDGAHGARGLSEGVPKHYKKRYLGVNQRLENNCKRVAIEGERRLRWLEVWQEVRTGGFLARNGGLRRARRSRLGKVEKTWCCRRIMTRVPNFAQPFLHLSD
jgi:hypothetical protein